jgi:hypothetical protein
MRVLTGKMPAPDSKGFRRAFPSKPTSTRRSLKAAITNFRLAGRVTAGWNAHAVLSLLKG